MDQLPRQMDMFEAVFSTAEIGMAVLRDDGVVLKANDALGRFLARQPSQLEGGRFADLFVSARSSEPEFLAVLRDRDSFTAETQFVRGDGRVVTGLATYSALRDHSGGTDAIVTIVADITAEKEAVRAEKEREQSVRRAYADVVSAMTGGRLLILPHEELPDQLGERVLGPIEFHDDVEPGEIRHAIRDYAKTRVEKATWDDGFEVAIGEALLNALKHAGGGTLSLHEYDTVLQAVVEDRGPGIDFTEIARGGSEEGLPMTHTFGVGFTLILSFTSRILLATGREGTTVVLEGHDDGPDKTLPD